MTTFVVLLRGINVGSNRKVPMADLREACVALGLERPQTYIQSGNVIVDADGDADGVRDLLEPALTERFGFPVDVVVRSVDGWDGYVAANPFAGDESAGPRMVHLYLSRGALDPAAVDTLMPRALNGERLRSAAGALWIDYGENGAGRSKLTPALIDKACGSPTTGRNWNSVLKIADMLRDRAG